MRPASRPPPPAFSRSFRGSLFAQIAQGPFLPPVTLSPWRVHLPPHRPVFWNLSSCLALHSGETGSPSRHQRCASQVRELVPPSPGSWSTVPDSLQSLSSNPSPLPFSQGSQGPGASCSETGVTSTEQGLTSLGWQGPLMATADPRPREVPSGRGGASPFTLSLWPVLGPAPRLSTASVPFCFPRNRGHGVMQSALFVRELDPEHTRSKEMSYAAIGFAGSPLSRPCSHLWTLQCVSQGLQGKQPGRVPADSPWVWVLQARYYYCVYLLPLWQKVKKN